jgi:hypothetical protein
MKQIYYNPGFLCVALHHCKQTTEKPSRRQTSFEKTRTPPGISCIGTLQRSHQRRDEQFDFIVKSG